MTQQPADGGAQLVVETRILEPAITAVSAAGSVDDRNAPALRAAMIAAIDAGALYLVIELEQLEGLDSTGLGVLVGVLKRLYSRDGSMYLVGASARIQKIFQITGLVNVLPSAADTAAALVSIHAPGAAERTRGCDEPG